MFVTRICILTLVIFVPVVCMAQTDSGFHSMKDIPLKYISTVNQKISEYSKRVDSKTVKTLDKLARWEKKIHALLQRISPETAEKLFGNNQLTFAMMLEKYKKGEAALNNYRQQYNEYTDKLSTSIKYLQEQQAGIDHKLAGPIKSVKQKVDELKEDEKRTAFIQQFIKERKKQLADQAVKYIGNSRYLKKIDKEAWYYVETVRNYKDIFQDKKKAEETAFRILNRLPAFQKFMKENSELASLFSIPGNYGSSQSLAGLQTRSSVNALLQDRLAAGGPGAMEQVRENMQAAQAQLQQLKDKLIKSGANDAGMPDFKPNTQKTKTFKQRLEFGSNLQFSKVNGFIPATADIAFTAGYKLNDKSIAGLGVSYKAGLGNIQHIHISNQGVGLRSFIDWKLKKQLYVSGGFEMNYNAQFKSIDALKAYNSWQQSGLIGLAKKINIKTKWFKGSKMQLLYDILASKHIPVSQPVIFRIGYQF